MKFNFKPIFFFVLTAMMAVLSSCDNRHNKATADTTVQTQSCSIEHARAVEAVIWGIPAVNYDRMYQAAIKAGGKFNQFVYWSKPSDWKNQLLTPNTDALYIIPFFNTKEVGPIVLEIPAAGKGTIVGSIMDCWQMPLEDVGTAGADAGKGGKYLILPPGYKEKIPAGYIILPSHNYEGYALLRALPKSGSEADIAEAVTYMKTIKLYPLSTAGKPSESVYVDVTNTVFDASIPYDVSFLESLDRMVQTEPWLERDKVMIDMLKTIGIEKGKPFAPDAKTTETLVSALSQAHNYFAGKFESFEPFDKGSRWFFPVDKSYASAAISGFTAENEYPVDGRGLVYYWAFSAMKHGNANQLYLFATHDKTGNPLQGDKTYRLVVPAKVPVNQYWSATAYNKVTHTLIRDVAYASRSSLTPELKTNTDGTVELFFGPEAPAGKESNWIPTKAGLELEIIFRFYGVEKPVRDKTWVLNDLEEVK